MIITVFRGSDYLTRKESKKTQNTGLFASDDKNIALSYVSNKGYLFELKLNVPNKYVVKIDCKNKSWNKLSESINLTTDNLIRYIKLKCNNVKLIILENIIDFGGKINKYTNLDNLQKPTNTYCILDENIIVDKKIIKLNEVN